MLVLHKAMEIAKSRETTIHTISLEEKLAFCLCEYRLTDVAGNVLDDILSSS